MTDPSPAFRIDGELTIYSAAAICAALKDAVAATPAGAPFELDLAGVTEMDSAGVQLLLAASRSLQAHAGSLRIAAASAPVREALEALQLAAHFDATH